MSKITKRNFHKTNSVHRRFIDFRELIASPANPMPLVRFNGVVPEGRLEENDK